MYLIKQVSSLSSFLQNTMKYEGIKILFCDNYINTSTGKKVICSDGSVEMVACDTDIHCLLFNHMTVDLGKSIFISTTNLGKSSGQNVSCGI